MFTIIKTKGVRNMKTEIIKCELPNTTKKSLSKYYGKAKDMLCNEKKLEKFLVRLETKLRKIPKCGNKLAPDAMFCSKCGNKVQQELKCNNCGRSLEPGDMFCSGCGHPVNE